MKTNREIKFRAWDKERKVMSPTASLAEWIHKQPEWKVAQKSNPYESEDIVFQQFTGLKDSNGKEIYEGDVVEYMKAGKKVRGLVDWQNRTVSFSHVYYNTLSHEVIGNIYENEDLIKDHENKN